MELSSHLGDAARWLLKKTQRDPTALLYHQWLTGVESLYGDVWGQAKVQAHCEKYGLTLGCRATPAELLFILQTLYGILARAVLFYRWSSDQSLAVSEVLSRLADPEFYHRQWGVRHFLPKLWDAGYLAFCHEEELSSVFQPMLTLARQIAEQANSEVWRNLLTDLYEGVISRPIRHDLGEYFTPYWLAQTVIEMTGFRGRTGEILFDPGCGSGAFLLAAAEMKLQTAGRASAEVLDDILHTVIGCDINPLSVLSARLNLLWWLAERFPMPLLDVELPILHYDTVFSTPLGNTAQGALQHYLPEGCDYLVGNPPWISWNALPPQYRKRLEKELLPRYVLFDFHGQEARLGHSNDDYLVTFSWVTIDRYLHQGGTCGFIIKQPLLTNVSGKTFRHFAIRCVHETTPLCVKRVADLRQINPFGIANETAIIVLQKGERTAYPLPYEIWSKADGHFEIATFEAQPSSMADLASPWVVLTPELEQTQFMAGRCPYTIRHGLKHDVADVLIVHPIERHDGILVIERARPRKSNRSPERYKIEPDVVYPFVQPRHLTAWGVRSYTYVIIPQRKAGENNEREFRQAFPLTYAYLQRFAPAFAARRSRIFSGTPFYGLFGLGDYTWSPYKVCWCGLGFRPEFAVVGPVEDTFVGTKPVVPDGTVYFIPVDEQKEAHFLCAVLNSSIVRTFLSARSGKSKRGLSKKMMEQLRLPIFNRDDERHLWLAHVSRRLHEQAAQRGAEPTMPAELDSVVTEVFRAEPIGQLALF